MRATRSASRVHSRSERTTRCGRAGVSTLDYILVLAVILPLAAVVLPTGMRIIRSVYEMTTVLISWPFL